MKNKNKKVRVRTTSKEILQHIVKKMVLTPLEKQDTPTGILWRIQLYTYWLAEAIQSRALDPKSSRFYAFFEGDRKQDLISTAIFLPEDESRVGRFENEAGYYNLIHRIVIQIQRLKGNLDNDLPIQKKVTEIEKEGLKIDQALYECIAKGRPITNSAFEKIVRFKMLVDNLIIS